MKNLKMKKIAAAVGFGVVMSAAAGQAAAESLLFPYYQVGNGVFTFLSTLTSSGNPAAGFPATSAPNIHYIWNYKTDMNNKTSACTHSDLWGATTSWDLMQQTVESPTAPNGNKLNLSTAFGDKSVPAYALTAPSTGFMIVDSTADLEGDFRGQAIIVDAVNGIMAAYKGLNNPASTADGTFNNILTSHGSYDMTWYPTKETGSTLGAAGVDTTWNVLVTGGPSAIYWNGTAYVASPVGQADLVGMSSVSGYGANGWTGAGVLVNGFNNAVDRDEAPISGNSPVPLVCMGNVKRADFLGPDQQIWTANGGYAWEVFLPRNNNLATAPASGMGVNVSATGVLMTKIEATTALGGVMRTAISQENAFPNLPY